SRKFQKWVETTIEKFDPDVISFMDDIPVNAKKQIKDRRIFLYVQYPLLAQEPKVEAPLSYTIGNAKRINYSILTDFADKLLITDPKGYCQEFLTISTVALTALKKIGMGKTPKIIYPYFQIQSDYTKITGNEKIICSIGTFSRHKNFETLIRSFACVEYRYWKLLISGYSSDPGYLKFLKRLFAKLNISSRIFFLTNVEKSKLLEILSKSSIVVHSAMFEPIGRAPLQATLVGNIPVARKNEYSGVWKDVLVEGKYRYCFTKEIDLTVTLNRLVESDLNEDRKRAIERSNYFDYSRFSSAFEEILR
ncbi:MAG: glycosyltransferase, partial [Thermodesulfobium sp.]